MLLPAFNPVILTEQGIFYPLEYIPWQEVKSCDRPVWLDDIFYIEGKKLRLSRDNKEKVETILTKYIPDCLSKS